MRVIEVPNEHLSTLNQVFEIEKKLAKIQEPNSINRNLERIKEVYQQTYGLTYENLTGQKYDETRTDCEASIAGDSLENLVITEVIKPLIRYGKDGISAIVQKAVVIVSAKPAE